MADTELLDEFEESLEDPILRSWMRAYIAGDTDPDELVQAAVNILEHGDADKHS